MVMALNEIGELFNILIERNVVANDEKVINFYYSPMNYGNVICKAFGIGGKWVQNVLELNQIKQNFSLFNFWGRS